MSGHSKWSKVKHQKAVTDVVKGQAFTKASRAITIAVREGGGATDPNNNFRLRLAIEKARAVNMPKDTIERAIAKGKGEGDKNIRSLMYEGYGPGGVAVVVEAASDNNQRTVALVKNIFDRYQGSLAQPGAVSYLFERCGVLTVPVNSGTYDHVLSVALDAGAKDFFVRDDVYEIYTLPQNLHDMSKKFESVHIPVDNQEIIMRPITTVSVADDMHNKIMHLSQEMEALDDIIRVYTNEA